ncbi:MAG: hypothetical protein KF757_03725 [Phycisphaeraceae bacterium]|nr:hypothetical protein [Phycisphaeraceae bacterium]MCW5763113.1 hypothetical protein [Phycisphaeraceae bacterium]
MACGTGFCAAKLIAGVVAIGLGGFGAYNFATTGCVLGNCSTDKAAITETSTTTDDKGCCPLGDAAVVEVAGAGVEIACHAAKTECTEVKECTDKAIACTDKAIACTGEKTIEVAAKTDCATACEGKTACADKKDCGGCDPASCTGPCGEVAAKSTEKSDG